MASQLGEKLPAAIVISLSFLMLAQLQSSKVVHQQMFSQTNAVPTKFCQKIRTPVFNLNQCFQLCLYNYNTDMFSLNIYTDECMCCEFGLSGVAENATEWISFYQKCPKGYVAMRYRYVETCLKFIETPVHYPEASSNCQTIKGDLVRLDSYEKLNLFRQFLDDHATRDDIWIQGVKDSSNVFKFHDGVVFKNICPRKLSTQASEIFLRYKISASECWDYDSSGYFSYVCEYVAYP